MTTQQTLEEMVHSVLEDLDFARIPIPDEIRYGIDDTIEEII